MQAQRGRQAGDAGADDQNRQGYFFTPSPRMN
jgi:hypothetical protein